MAEEKEERKPFQKKNPELYVVFTFQKRAGAAKAESGQGWVILPRERPKNSLEVNALREKIEREQRLEGVVLTFWATL